MGSDLLHISSEGSPQLEKSNEPIPSKLLQRRTERGRVNQSVEEHSVLCALCQMWSGELLWGLY